MTRTWLRAGLAAAAMAACLAVAAPALAVGVDGVDMALRLPRDPAGHMPLTVDDRPASGEILLENRTAEARTVKLYAVAASVHDGGAVELGMPGSARWLGVPERTVELPAGAREAIPFTTEPGRLGRSGDIPTHAAVILESARGETLVVQAASLITLLPATAPLHWPWILIASVLLVLVATGLARHLRDERRRSGLGAPSPVRARQGAFACARP